MQTASLPQPCSEWASGRPYSDRSVTRSWCFDALAELRDQAEAMGDTALARAYQSHVLTAALSGAGPESGLSHAGRAAAAAFAGLAVRRLARLTSSKKLKTTLHEFRDTLAFVGRVEDAAAVYGLIGPLGHPVSPGIAAWAPVGVRAPEDGTMLRVRDGAVPRDVLEQLQHGFREGAPYWKEIDSPREEFHSWWVPRESWPQAGALGAYFGLLLQNLPGSDVGADIVGAEFWVHRRPLDKSLQQVNSVLTSIGIPGHQFHYDTDENQDISKYVHPKYSSVLFLEGSVGGATVVTNITSGRSSLADYEPEQDPCNTGWPVPPETNRMVTFRGELLHGVLPGGGLGQLEERRVTLMVGLWSTPCGKRSKAPLIGPCAPAPLIGNMKDFSWQRDLEMAGAGVHALEGREVLVPRVTPAFSSVLEFMQHS